jgi:hypothetical protein
MSKTKYNFEDGSYVGGEIINANAETYDEMWGNSLGGPRPYDNIKDLADADETKLKQYVDNYLDLLIEDLKPALLQVIKENQTWAKSWLNE